MCLALPDLIKALQWSPQDTGLAVVLGSRDTQLVPTKLLPQLGASVASELQFKWLPSLLSKHPHRPVHGLNGAAERVGEFEKAQYKATQVAGGLKRILVLDDMITRGSTLTHIAQAVRAIYPEMEIVGISLGKNEKQACAALFGHSISNDSVPHSWATAWDGCAEE